MAETTGLQEKETVSQAAAETKESQGDGKGHGMEGTTEKVSALQKFIDGLFGGKEAKEAETENKETETKKTETANKAEDEKSYTQSDLDAAIGAAKKAWKKEAEEAERVKKLSPEEKAAEEQQKKDSEIVRLQSELLRKELRETASKALEKDGFPVGLADVLDYSSKERMEETLKNTTAVFKDSLATAIQGRLKGKTPEGLGSAASAENLLRDQIARNIRGL